MTRVKICGITRLEDAELAASLGAWAIGFLLGRRRSATWTRSRRRHRASDAPQGRARRRVRQPAAGRDRRPGRCARAVAHPAARRRGPVVLRRRAPAHGRKGDQGRAHRRHRRPARPRSLPHRLPPARHRAGGCLWRHRAHVGLVAAQAAPQQDAVPAGRGPEPRQCRRGDRGHPPVGDRRVQRRRERARHQGPRQAAGAVRGGRGRRARAAAVKGARGARVPAARGRRVTPPGGHTRGRPDGGERRRQGTPRGARR